MTTPKELNSKELRILFYGTPEFAVTSLDKLLKNNYNIVSVVTSTDKPAGRGLLPGISDVKKYALSNNLKILQPLNLKSNDFIEELKSLKPDLQIVIAFRYLPEVVWQIPPMGTINLHASLLPQYKGAAPINWAIINGEKHTGITTFFINSKIDSGQIILAEKVEITSDETAGSLHDKLMNSGAELIIKTVDLIAEGNIKLQETADKQSDLLIAPKIFKETCRINWSDKAINIYNFVRGLSPYPAAFTEFISPEQSKYILKVFKVSIDNNMPVISPKGSIITDNKQYLGIVIKDAIIKIEELQLAGKKRMSISEFLKGFRINNNWIVNHDF